MTQKGHNGPPPFEAHSMHIEDLFKLVSDTTAGGEVVNDEQEAALDDLMDQMRQAWKGADAERVSEKRPHDEAAKAVQAKWKPLLDRANAGIAEIKAKLTPYRTAKQRARDEAERKAREEAAERLRMAQEAHAHSDDLESRFEAEQNIAAAKKLTVAANKSSRETTGLRTYWEAEITDRRAALNAYLKRRPEAFMETLERLAAEDARGARPAVPGVLYHERKKAA